MAIGSFTGMIGRAWPILIVAGAAVSLLYVRSASDSVTAIEERTAPTAERPPAPLTGLEPRIVPTATKIEAAPELAGGFPEAGHEVRAPDFEGLVFAYDSFAGRQLESFNSRYRGALDFGSPDEFRWLQQQGFPLPGQIIAAASMTTDELAALARAGDETAEFLYFDRLLQEAAEARRSYLDSGLPSSALLQNNEYIRAFIAADQMRIRIADARSPFAGYLLARFSEVALDDPYGVMAGLHHAYVLGDRRAYPAIERLARDRSISADARHAMAAYSLILRRTGITGTGETATERPENQ